MFKNRSFNFFAGLTIAVLAVLSIGSLAFAQPTLPVSETNQLAPLKWYFGNPHAIIDGDNNVVSNVSIPFSERYSVLKDKQLEQFDAVAPAVTAPEVSSIAGRYSALKDKQLEGLDTVAFATTEDPRSTDR